MLRFEEALERYRKRRLTAEEAGEVLGMSGRHFRRLLLRQPGHRVAELVIVPLLQARAGPPVVATTNFHPHLHAVGAPSDAL